VTDRKGRRRRWRQWRLAVAIGDEEDEKGAFASFVLFCFNLFII
jgi:hypothetical protein